MRCCNPASSRREYGTVRKGSDNPKTAGKSGRGGAWYPGYPRRAYDTGHTIYSTSEKPGQQIERRRKKRGSGCPLPRFRFRIPTRSAIAARAGSRCVTSPPRTRRPRAASRPRTGRRPHRPATAGRLRRSAAPPGPAAARRCPAKRPAMRRSARRWPCR